MLIIPCIVRVRQGDRIRVGLEAWNTISHFECSYVACFHDADMPWIFWVHFSLKKYKNMSNNQSMALWIRISGSGFYSRLVHWLCDLVQVKTLCFTSPSCPAATGLYHLPTSTKCPHNYKEMQRVPELFSTHPPQSSSQQFAGRHMKSIVYLWGGKRKKGSYGLGLMYMSDFCFSIQEGN